MVNKIEMWVRGDTRARPNAFPGAELFGLLILLAFLLLTLSTVLSGCFRLLCRRLFLCKGNDDQTI
jgi:hypothetical protein